jgi:hypothetical protein
LYIAQKILVLTGYGKSYEETSLKLGMVVHNCNPSYSGGGSRKILSLRPAWATQQDPVSKKEFLLIKK